jgi:hypothetical protein
MRRARQAEAMRVDFIGRSTFDVGLALAIARGRSLSSM